MSNKLQEICAAKAEHVALYKERLSDSLLQERISAQSAPRGFVANMRKTIANNVWALIAEVKKASPSKGLIREDFSPADHARDYETGGASCLSVLTDIPYFQGHDDYLLQARAATTLPCLRKDFMVDPWQITESRALGADAILIIVAACDDILMRELAHATLENGMDMLIEVHNREELDRALALDTNPDRSLIGVNNRDLKRFVTDLAVTEELMQYVPKDHLIVSESGIAGHDDCVRLDKAGIKAFLVGETLMRKDDLVMATREVLNGPET
ncbi:indole-3-glycerol phosphate synthase TrpC [Parasphingorhabdus sp. DH2-15]|uniref:indole-3-glycerol phosphate synthase TrpC n=1 Tax=Parasphingorhabdus sp. DH2-15 TaxID=3444112 RepID=UPI003F689626